MLTWWLTDTACAAFGVPSKRWFAIDSQWNTQVCLQAKMLLQSCNADCQSRRCHVLQHMAVTIRAPLVHSLAG